jgi:hypothetical protein
MENLLHAVINCQNAAQHEDEDSHKPPEVNSLALAVGKTLVGGRLSLAHAKQQEHLVRRIGKCVNRLCQHRRAARDRGRHQLDERNNYVDR